MALVARFCRRKPLGALGGLIVAGLLAMALFARWIAPHDYDETIRAARMKPPGVAYWMGTDNLGRDIFSRVIKGSQIALIVGVTSIVISQIMGLMLGLVAGYAPRWLDNILLLVFDSIYSFPTVMLGLTVMTLLSPSLGTLMFVVVVIQTPGYARLVRTATLAKMNSEYILAERSLGAGPVRILALHILPNIVGPLFILGSMDIPSVITLEAGLTYLGMGIPPPAPSWGRILDEGYKLIREAPWIVVGGGIPLIITTLGFTFLGEALRDMIDPKLRRIV
jgi:peptide/nickel transport system permease protein